MSKQRILSDKLIFTSSNFDPELALKSKELAERCSGAKVFDNLRQYVIGLRQSASFKSIGWFPKEFEERDFQHRKSSKRKASDLYDKRDTASSDVSSSDLDDEKRRKPKHVKLTIEPKIRQKSESGSEVSFRSLFSASSDDAAAISDQGIQSKNKRSYDSKTKTLQSKDDDNKKNVPLKQEASKVRETSGIRESNNEKRASLQSRLKSIAKNPAQNLKSSSTDQRLAKFKNVMIENLEKERKEFVAKNRSNVFQKMEAFQDGPFSVLYNCMSKGIKLKVWTRRYKGLRGVCTGYLIAFDKHMNLAMIDVDEVYTLEIRTLSQEEQNEIKRKKKAEKKNRYRLNRINKTCGFINDKENKELMERNIKSDKIAASSRIVKHKIQHKFFEVEDEIGADTKAGNGVSSQKTMSSSGSQAQCVTEQKDMSLHSSSGALSLQDAGVLPSSVDIALENADKETDKAWGSSVAGSEKPPMVSEALVVNSPSATMAYKKPHSVSNITSFPVDSDSQQPTSSGGVSSSLLALISQDLSSSAALPPKELSSPANIKSAVSTASSSRKSLEDVASGTIKVPREIVTSQSSPSAADVLSTESLSLCPKDIKSSSPDSMSKQFGSLPVVASKTTKVPGEIVTSQSSMESLSSCSKVSSADSISEQSGSLPDAVSVEPSALLNVSSQKSLPSMDVQLVPDVTSTDFSQGKSQTEFGRKELLSQIEKDASACDLSFDISESSDDELTNDNITGRISDSDEEDIRIKDFLSGIHTLGNMSATSHSHKAPITGVITSLPDRDCRAAEKVAEKHRDEESEAKQEPTHRVKCHFSLFSRLSRPPQLNSSLKDLSGESNLMRKVEKPEDIPAKIKEKIEGRGIDKQDIVFKSSGTEEGKLSQRCLDMKQGNLLLSESSNDAAKSQLEDSKSEQYIGSKKVGEKSGRDEQFSSENSMKKDSTSQQKLQEHTFVSTQEDKHPIEGDITIKSQEELYKMGREESRADLPTSFESRDVSSEISKIRKPNESDYSLVKLDLKPCVSYSQMEIPFHLSEGTVMNSVDVTRDPRLKKMKDTEIWQRNMEKRFQDVLKSDAARQVDPRVHGIGRKGHSAEENADARKESCVIDNVCEQADVKGRIVAREQAITTGNSDKREERRAKEASKEQVDARKQNICREIIDAKVQLATGSDAQGNDVSRKRAQASEDVDQRELLFLRENSGELSDASRQGFEKELVDTQGRLAAKDDAVGCNVASNRVQASEKLDTRDLLSVRGLFQEQINVKGNKVDREISDTEHLAFRADAEGSRAILKRIQAEEKLDKRERGQVQIQFDPRRQSNYRIERYASVENTDGKSFTVKSIDTRITVASRKHVPVIEPAVASMEQSRSRTHSDQSDSTCTKQKPRQTDPRLRSRRSTDERSNSDVDQPLVNPKQNNDDSTNKAGFSTPSIVSEHMSKLLSLLGTNLNTASVGGKRSSNIQLIKEQTSERSDTGGFSQRGKVKTLQVQGQCDTDASKSDKTVQIKTESQSNDTKNALEVSAGDKLSKSDTTTLVSVSEKHVVSRNVEKRDNGSIGTGLVEGNDKINFTEELKTSKDTNKDEEQMSTPKSETGFTDLKDSVKCTKEQRSSKDISNDEKQEPKPEGKPNDKIMEEERDEGDSVLARFFQKRRPLNVCDQKQTLIKPDLSKTKSNLKKQSAPEVIFSRGKVDHPKRTLPTVSAVFDPKKPLPGHVFKERHVNQLFIRGDNIAMVAYDQKS